MPFFAISPAFRHREVQKDCQNRTREIGYMPLEKGEKAVNVSLFSVRYVFVGFVEGEESGNRNPECGIRNPSPFVICGKSFRIYNIFLYLFILNYRILSRKSQKSS